MAIIVFLIILKVVVFIFTRKHRILLFFSILFTMAFIVPGIVLLNVVKHSEPNSEPNTVDQFSIMNMSSMNAISTLAMESNYADGNADQEKKKSTSSLFEEIVNMVDFSVVIDGQTLSGRVVGPTVREAIVQLGGVLNLGAYSSVPLDEEISEISSPVIISNEKTVKVTDNNNIKEITGNEPTVRDLLSANNIALGLFDKTVPSVDASTTEGMNIVIIRGDRLRSFVTETIPLPPITKDDPSLPTGLTKTSLEGSPKIIEKVVKISFENGSQKKFKIIKTKVIFPGVAPVVLRGSGPVSVDLPTTEVKKLGYQLMLDAGFGADQWQCLDKLWMRESGWNPAAVNKSSGATGIPQSLPGSKMASEGDDWRTNPETQIKWGLKYISERYGDPCNALKKSDQLGWY